MMWNSIIFVLIYLLGRLMFYPITIVLDDKSDKKLSKIILLRVLTGLLFYLLINDVWIASISFVLLGLSIIFDTKVIPAGIKYRRTLYALHILTGIIIIPKSIYIMQSLFPESFNIINVTWVRIANILPEIGNSSDSNSIIKIMLVICGYLFTLKESTILIRLTLKSIEVTPKIRNDPQKPDDVEYERGRLIGILERTFFYFLVLFDKTAAIAIIIALKSLARFRELDNKEFAEYFLIGSLLSLLWATFPAVLLRFIF